MLQLPQALRAKAFRVELVEQLRNDADACKLLLQIYLKLPIRNKYARPFHSFPSSRSTDLSDLPLPRPV